MAVRILSLFFIQGRIMGLLDGSRELPCQYFSWIAAPFQANFYVTGMQHLHILRPCIGFPAGTDSTAKKLAHPDLTHPDLAGQLWALIKQTHIFIFYFDH